jgi:hypothetical protein
MKVREQREHGNSSILQVAARRVFGRSICKKLPVAFISMNISTKAIKYAI